MHKNKKINKIKFSITTNCNLKCDYCFVNKTNETIDLATAKIAVNILMESYGVDKLLSVYGGEPSLNIDLLKEIIDYSVDKAKKINKKLTISICTNLTNVSDKFINLLKDNDIKIIFTLLGEKQLHDRCRTDYKNLGTYDLVIKNYFDISQKIPTDNFSVAFCVFPDNVKNLEKHFKHLLSLGLRHFNLEIIRDYVSWNKEDLGYFKIEYTKILKHVFENIKIGDFIYINPVNWEIKKNRISDSFSNICPFSYNLEIHPNGNISFSPFLFDLGDDFIIGNLKDNIFKYNDCSYSSDSKICIDCKNNYFNSYKKDEIAFSMYSIYENLSKNGSNYLESKQNDTNIKKYINSIKNNYCW